MHDQIRPDSSFIACHIKFKLWFPEMLFKTGDRTHEEGHFGASSAQIDFVSIHPSPGKKSVR